MQPILSTLKLIDWREVITIVGRGLVVLAVLTYWAGWGLGKAVHAASGCLARSPRFPLTAVQAPAAVPAPEVTVSTGARDLLTMQILALRADGLSQQAIADRVGASRTTVRRRLATA